MHCSHYADYHGSHPHSQGDEEGLMRSPPSNPTFGFKRRGSVSGGTFGEQVPPEPPSKLILQNSLRNSDLNWWDYNRWDYGWEHVSHCLELILLILWDREVGVGGRGNLLFPQITEKRGGGSGGGILPSPGVSSPYVTAYVSPLTTHSGEGSGRPSISKCVSSSRQSVMSEANYTLTGGGGRAPSRGSEEQEA